MKYIWTFIVLHIVPKLKNNNKFIYLCTTIKRYVEQIQLLADTPLIQSYSFQFPI